MRWTVTSQLEVHSISPNDSQLPYYVVTWDSVFLLNAIAYM